MGRMALDRSPMLVVEPPVEPLDAGGFIEPEQGARVGDEPHPFLFLKGLWLGDPDGPDVGEIFMVDDAFDEVRVERRMRLRRGGADRGGGMLQLVTDEYQRGEDRSRRDDLGKER